MGRSNNRGAQGSVEVRKTLEGVGGGTCGDTPFGA